MLIRLAGVCSSFQACPNWPVAAVENIAAIMSGVPSVRTASRAATGALASGIFLCSEATAFSGAIGCSFTSERFLSHMVKLAASCPSSVETISPVVPKWRNPMPSWVLTVVACWLIRLVPIRRYFLRRLHQ